MTLAPGAPTPSSDPMPAPDASTPPAPQPADIVDASPLTPSAAPGWYPEPGNNGVLRYWNGSTWEEWRQAASAPAVAPAPTNGIAVTALVFSIAGVALDLTILFGLFGFLAGIVGLICGSIASRRSVTLGRRGTALWAFWLGLVGVLLPILVVAAIFVIRLIELRS